MVKGEVNGWLRLKFAPNGKHVKGLLKSFEIATPAQCINVGDLPNKLWFSFFGGCRVPMLERGQEHPKT